MHAAALVRQGSGATPAALQAIVDTFRADLGPITGFPGGLLTVPEDQHYLSEIPEPRHGMIRRLFNAVLAFASRSPEVRGKMGAYSYERVKEVFSWPVVVKGFEKLFGEVSAR